MNILLNAITFTKHTSGANQRFIGLYGEFIRQNPKLNFFIYQPRDCNISFHGSLDLKNIFFINSSVSSETSSFIKFFMSLFDLRNILIKKKIDIYEGYSLPFFQFYKSKKILTIHDIRDFYYAYSGNFLRFLVYKVILFISIKSANYIIAVSNTSKKELLRHYPNSKISVVYNGIDKKLFDKITEIDLKKIKNKYFLPKYFLLSVGHFEKRKNYKRLIDAFNVIKKNDKKQHLVLVGKKNQEVKKLKDQITALNLDKSVLIINSASDFEIRCIYKLSNIFVSPSLYEGFGIPVLEAMAAKVPFVLSDIDVFKEITNNEGLYFDPENTDSITNKILYLINNDYEKKRLIKYAEKRINDFDFNQLTFNLKKLYKKIDSL